MSLPKKKPLVMYEDEWSRITQTELIIKWYYFPTAQNKRIDVSTIRGIYYQSQDDKYPFGVLKGWGMSLSPCWWSCDIKRHLRGHETARLHWNIAIDCGQTWYQGFTTNDIHQLLHTVREVFPRDCIIANGLPFYLRE